MFSLYFLSKDVQKISDDVFIIAWRDNLITSEIHSCLNIFNMIKKCWEYNLAC